MPVPLRPPPPFTPADDERFMALALDEARVAGAGGDVPIGAVVVVGGEVVARAGNRRERDLDPTAHAEILALRAAAAAQGDWHLEAATLYVTLEPCFMCAGALVNARLGALVFGAPDPKAGAVGSLADVPSDVRLNHRLPVRSGVLAGAAAELLQAFFRARRAPTKPSVEAGVGPDVRSVADPGVDPDAPASA